MEGLNFDFSGKRIFKNIKFHFALADLIKIVFIAYLEIIFEEPSQFIEQNCFDLNENPPDKNVNFNNNNLLDSLRKEDEQ